jgi:hypothetical protein
VVTVPTREETQEATTESQHLSQNDNNDNEDEEEGNEDEDIDDEEYTPLSNYKKEKMYHDADEIKTAKNEALIPTYGLSDLLNCIDITTPPEFRIKRVPRLGRGRVQSNHGDPQ